MESRFSKVMRTGGSAWISRARCVGALAHARAAFQLSFPRIRLPRQTTGPASSGARRILLLTSTLGSGHLRAAQAIEIAVRERLPEARVEMLDFWSLMDERVANAGRQTYLRLVQERPELYDRIYQLDQRTWRKILDSNETPPPAFAEVIALVPAMRANDAQHASRGRRHASDRMVLPALCAALAGHPRHLPELNRLARLVLIKWCWTRLAKRLRARVSAFRPDAIVATQMNSAALLSSIKRHSGLDTPTIGVLTDFGVHDFWIQPGIDRYCVAHESMVANLRGAGIAAQRVSVTGIPLMPGFRHPPSQSQARLQLGLHPYAPVVLVPGGGLGLGVAAVAECLLRRPGNAQLLVIAGHNAAARMALAPLATRYGPRLRVCDWTEQMELFFRAADVVVGKPGGLTVAETLACGRPLLATCSLRGQEGFDVEFLERHGVGRLVSQDELADAVESLLRVGAELARIQDRARALGRRDGAAQVAELVHQSTRIRSSGKVAEAH